MDSTRCGPSYRGGSGRCSASSVGYRKSYAAHCRLAAVVGSVDRSVRGGLGCNTGQEALAVSDVSNVDE